MTLRGVLSLTSAVGMLLVLWISLCEAATPLKNTSKNTSEFHTVVDLEHTARLLAILLDCGRAVVNEHQAWFIGDGNSDDAFTPENFEYRLRVLFRERSGVDFGDFDSVNLPPSAKRLVRELVLVSKRVATSEQVRLRGHPHREMGLIPALFGAKVAMQFGERTGVRMKQTALLARNPSNTPDTMERQALEMFADPAYPREKVISEMTARDPVLRLMFPLYMTRQCLDCHGTPKGELDKTGYPKEGLKLGDNAGAISVIIPARP